MRHIGSAALPAILLLAACGGGGEPLPAPPNSQRIPVPSDRTAHYYLLKNDALPNGHREALVQTNSVPVSSDPSRANFNRMEVDCAAQMSRSLGNGHSVEAAQRGDNADATMFPPQPTSPTVAMIAFICSR